MTSTVQLPTATRLGPVNLIVTDADRARAFYADTLGLHAIMPAPDQLVLSAGEGGEPLLILHIDPDAPERHPRSTGLYHAAILFESRSELANVVMRLLNRGVSLTGASDHLVSEAIYLDDPDGIGLELYADRPRSTWPIVDGGVQMATLPLDMNDLLQTATDWDRPAPATTQIGHIHLHVADLERAVTFYREVIGFDLMLRYGPAAAFLSAGGYHHHLGLNTWAGVGAPRPPEGAVGLRSYTIVLPERDDLVTLRDRVTAHGIDVITGDDTQFSTTDPDGHQIYVVVE